MKNVVFSKQTTILLCLICCSVNATLNKITLDYARVEYYVLFYGNTLAVNKKLERNGPLGSDALARVHKILGPLVSGSVGRIRGPRFDSSHRQKI